MSGLFMIDLEGYEILDIEHELLTLPSVGAVILFSQNVQSSEQLKQLTSDIHRLRPDCFIAIDHEGGIVQRIQRHGFRALPAARVYGEAYDINKETGIELARRYGAFMAQDLLDHGIDLSLTPVLDLDGKSNVIGYLDRAFHKDADVVASLAGAFIEGMQSKGMPSVGKHFPGHGNCLLDSHIEKPVYEASKDELFKNDLVPFIQLINDRLLDGVMPAHVTYPALDPNFAAGYSTIWLQEILRHQLGFDGLIISDCLGMKGADVGDLHKRSVLARAAGCNMIIVSHQARQVLKELLRSESFSASNDSQQYLSRFREKMCRFNGGHENAPASAINNVSKQHDSNNRKPSKHERFNSTKSI
jgi:beta-N-acetylhexosaminidase